MYVTELISKENKLAHVRELDESDFKKITVKRYMFNWKKLKEGCRVYKLTLMDSNDILGLIALTDFPEEERIEIKLLTSSAENIGKTKQYDRIAGCLIAFAGFEAVKKFKNYPALSMLPKSELRQHYISRYTMLDAGWHVYLEDIALLNMIKEYL